MNTIITDRDIAQVAHEINRAYCQSLGDNSQPSWEDTPDWQKSSALAGVQFHHNNPDAGPEASHESWLKHKRQDGWIYGKIKDPDKKEHPCMVPFHSLPESQKSKDYLFRQIVHSLTDLSSRYELTQPDPEREREDMKENSL